MTSSDWLVYKTTWKFLESSGAFANTGSGMIHQCRSCRKGKDCKLPLMLCHVRTQFAPLKEEQHWVCFDCLRSNLGIKNVAHFRKQYRQWYNETFFAHLLHPLRNELSYLVRVNPAVKRFLDLVEHGEKIPPNVLQAVVNAVNE